MRPRLRNRFDFGLVLLVLGACGLITLLAPGWGDYPTDAGPPLSAIAHGHLSGFFAHQPAMGAISLFVRAPFVALGASLNASPFGLYRWGLMPCVLALGMLALWMSRIAGRRGSGRLAQLAIVAICLFNPLVRDAMYWGHPEELLTASFAVAALLAACEGRTVLMAVLAGLAIASKQWAVIVLAPSLLIIGRERVRATMIAGAVAAVATAPLLVANFAAFRHTLSYISKPQPVVTEFTWLYPFSPTTTVHATNIFGDARSFIGHKLYGVEALFSHPLIILLGLLVPVALWWRARGSLRADQVLALAGVAFLIRCALDPGSMPYYHVALLLTLVAIDAVTGRRLPVAGLAGGAASFVLFDRAAGYLGPVPSNALYVAVSAIALIALVHYALAADMETMQSVALRAPRLFGYRLGVR